MMVCVTIIGGAALALLGFILMKPIAVLLGAADSMLDDCVIYGQISMISLPAFMLQNVFQSFLITAERPRLGLAITVAAGTTNILLDFLFIVLFNGASLARLLLQPCAKSWAALHPSFILQKERLEFCASQNSDITAASFLKHVLTALLN